MSEVTKSPFEVPAPKSVMVPDSTVDHEALGRERKEQMAQIRVQEFVDHVRSNVGPYGDAADLYQNGSFNTVIPREVSDSTIVYNEASDFDVWADAARYKDNMQNKGYTMIGDVFVKTDSPVGQYLKSAEFQDMIKQAEGHLGSLRVEIRRVDPLKSGEYKLSVLGS